jgi:hypothetical protein
VHAESANADSSRGVPRDCASVYRGVHGQLICHPQKLKGGKQAARFGAAV